MASVSLPAAFLATDAAAGAGVGLADAAAVAGIGDAAAAGAGALSTGALAGTTAAGLSGIGDIAGGALAAGALGGAGGLAEGVLEGAGGLTTGGLDLGAGALGGTTGGGLTTGLSVAAPAAGAGIGAPSAGVLGGASAAAAPASAPVGAATSGVFDAAGGGGGAGASGGGASGLPTLSGQTLGAPVSGSQLAPASSSTFVDSPAMSDTALNLPGSGGAVNGSSPGMFSGSGGTSVAGSTPNLNAFTANPGVDTAWNLVKANPSVALGALGLGANLVMSNRALPGQNQISSAAGQMSAQSQELESYLNTGTLPPGIQSGLTSAGAAAKATIRSQHAAQGTSGSSAEMQELSNVDTTMTTQGANMAMQLFSTGLSEAGMSAQLYQLILQTALTQDQQLGSAVGRFASSLAPQTTTINLTPTTAPVS